MGTGLLLPPNKSSPKILDESLVEVVDFFVVVVVGSSSTDVSIKLAASNENGIELVFAFAAVVVVDVVVVDDVDAGVDGLVVVVVVVDFVVGVDDEEPNRLSTIEELAFGSVEVEVEAEVEVEVEDVEAV